MSNKSIIIPVNNKPTKIESVQNFVIVGANGSGKSHLGAWIEQQSANGEVLRISAQRALSIPDSITLNSSYKCDTYLFHRGQLFRHRIIFRNFLLTQTFSYIFQNTYARNKVFQLFLRDTEIFVIASFNVRTA